MQGVAEQNWRWKNAKRAFFGVTKIFNITKVIYNGSNCKQSYTYRYCNVIRDSCFTHNLFHMVVALSHNCAGLLELIDRIDLSSSHYCRTEINYWLISSLLRAMRTRRAERCRSQEWARTGEANVQRRWTDGSRARERSGGSSTRPTGGWGSQQRHGHPRKARQSWICWSELRYRSAGSCTCYLK